MANEHLTTRNRVDGFEFHCGKCGVTELLITPEGGFGFDEGLKKFKSFIKRHKHKGIKHG